MIEIPMFAYFLIINTTVVVMLMIALFAGHRRSPVFLLLVTVTAVWSLSSALHNLLPPGTDEHILQQVSRTTFIWMALIWVFLVMEFARLSLRVRRLSLLLGVPLAVFTVPLWTGQNQLPFDAFAASWWYGHVLNTIAITLLLPLVLTTKGERRLHSAILFLCTIVPMAIFLIRHFRGEPVEAISPSFLLFSAVLFTIGLLGFRLMHLLPIGYERILSGMRKGVIVVTPDGRIAYVNPAIEQILNQPAEAFVGRPAESALAAYPRLALYLCQSRKEVLEDVTFINGTEESIYEVFVTDLDSKRGRFIGRIATLNNITRRITTENELRHSRSMLQQSEEKYRSLVENVNEVIYVLSLEGVITYISPVIERYTGFSADDIIGQSFRRFVVLDDLPAVEAMIGQARSLGVANLEFRILDSNHQIRHVHTSTLLTQLEGQPAALQGVLTDITDRVSVEKALERQAAQLKIINAVGEQIAQVRELGSILDSAAHLIRKYFGYYHVALFTPQHETKELIMRANSGAFSQLFPENHRLRFDQGMVGWAAVNKTTLLANDVHQEPHYVNLYPDEISTSAELAVPILVKDNLVGVLDIQSPKEGAFTENDVRLMETVADQIAIAMENARLYDEVRLQLKERERREFIMRVQRDLLVRLSTARSLSETVHHAAENLAVALHAHRAAILLIDWDAKVARPVASLGYSRRSEPKEISLNEGIIGWVAQSGVAALFQDVGSGHSPCAGIADDTQSLLCVPLMTNSQPSGVILLESAEANAFTHEDQYLLSTLANSLVMLIERAQLFEAVESARTELEKRAGDLESANAGLREMDRIKSQFLANMSHELRTPLNSIIGFSEVLLDGIAGPLDDEQAECARDIHESGNHLLSLINDLLDFSRIEAGRMALDISTFQVTPLFESVRSTVAPMIEKKAQILTFQQAGTLPPVTGDPLRIKQVLINLVSNANKFTSVGGSISVSASMDDADHILFSVQDNGIGIRPEDQELIFEEFRQVDGTLTREATGSGLGLAISKQIVELHGGKIWVSSQPRKGATLFVRLPLLRTDTQAPVMEDFRQELA